MRLKWSVLAAALGIGCATSAALAQGTGRSLDIDLSIRSAGAGGASNAVFWGGDPNYWANPALLGLHRGSSYLWGKTQLVPDLADDVILKSQRYTFGLAGVGFAHAGDRLGEVRLDYGLNQGTDESGNPTGTYSSYETIESWGIGVSLSEFVNAIAGGRVALARHADVAIGYTKKDVVIALAPGAVGGIASGTGKDRGLLVRVSPILFDSGVGPGDLPLQLDFAYGYSVLNYNDERVVFLSEDLASPLTRSHRNGVSARIGLGLPEGLREGASPARRWLLSGLEPLVSFAIAKDWEHNSAGGQGSFYDVDRIGFEVSVANLIAGRIGHVSDKLGDIEGSTTGLSAGFRLGRLGGFRYDRASIPQADGLDHVQRKGFTAFIDLASLIPGRLGSASTLW